MTICDFCKKKILEIEVVNMCLKTKDDYGEDDFLLIKKHKDCGPYKKCYYKNCNKEYKFSSNEGELTYDIFIGIDEYTKKEVFINYCSQRCAKKDDYDLYDNEEELIENMKPRIITLGGVETKVFY